MRLIFMPRVVLLFSLAVALSAGAQQFVVPRPDPSKITVHRDLEHTSADGRTTRFDFYRPAGSEIVPIVVTCNFGNAQMRRFPGYVGWGEVTAAAGLASVHYEPAGPDPVAGYDALLEALRARAGELRIDPSRIVVWGGSSNVQLALPLAMDAKRSEIRGAVIYYGDAAVSEIRTDLPVFLARAGLDGPALNARIDALIGRAMKANAPWTIENYSGGLHGFDILNDTDISREIIRRTLDFMKSVTTPAVNRAYATAAADASLAAAFTGGQWDVAVKGYGERANASPNDGEAHLRLGIALDGAGRPAEGLKAIERAWELGRHGPRDTALPAARAAARSGDTERAMHWIGILLATPFVTLADLQADDAFGEIAKTPAFRTLVRDAEEQRRLLAMLEGSESAKAVAMLRADERLATEGLLNAAGYRLLGAGNDSAALEVFALAASRNPQSANAWESLSEALEKVGRAQESLETAKRALTLAPAQNVREAAEARVRRLSKR